MTTKEGPYAQALADKAQTERALYRVHDRVMERADWLASKKRTQTDTLFSAVRGNA